MIIQKKDDCFLIKIYKEQLGDFDVFDRENITDLFQKILIKLLDKYDIKGLLDVDVFVDLVYGMIIEIREIYSYHDEVDMQIHFHLDSVFLNEIIFSDEMDIRNVYYYQGKFYKTYDGTDDSQILYQDLECEEIIDKGIKL